MAMMEADDPAMKMGSEHAAEYPDHEVSSPERGAVYCRSCLWFWLDGYGEVR